MSSRGFTLAEVTISIAVVTSIILASLGARYLTVQQAKRADAHNGAGKLALLLLEGWRGSATLSGYEPVSRFTGQMTISTSATGPATPTGFTTLGSYRVVLDNMNFYATLAYVNATTTAPAKMHVCVGYRSHFEAASVSSGANYVYLTTFD
jgi:prepilin-type N-terminal cleavage/methylation domain-containing protein